MNQENQMPGEIKMSPVDNPSEPPKMLEGGNKFNFKLDKNTVIIGVAVLAVIITLALILTNSGSLTGIFLSRQNVANKAIEYLNSNVLQPGQVATLGDVSQESGVIKLQVIIDGSTYDSYITKDGKLFFPQAYSLAGQSGQVGQQGGQVDISQVKTEGEPFIGEASAPVVMAYWFDYQCPFCKKHEQQVMSELVAEYVNSGKLKIVFKDYQFLGSDSTTAGLAAHAVWEINPAKFFEWHMAMFEKQDEENGGWGKKSDILALTASLGIDSARVDQLMTQKASEYQSEMDEDKAEGTALGINGTPGSIVGNQRIDGAQPLSTFKSAIDELLK